MMQPNGQEVVLQTGKVMGLAVAQLAVGCLCIIFGIVTETVFNVQTGFVGIWAPIPFVIAGILGILAANQRTSSLVNSHLVMSFLSTIAALVLFGVTCLYAIQLWTHIILVILSLTEFVLATVSAVLCGTCCKTSGQGVIVAGPQNGLVAVPPGHMVFQQPLATQQFYQPWVVQPGMQPAVYPATYSQNTATAPAVYPATYSQDTATAPAVYPATFSQDNAPPAYPASYAQEIVQDVPNNKCETPPYTEPANEAVQPPPYV